MFEIVDVETCNVFAVINNLTIARAETARLNAGGADVVLCYAGGFLVPAWN